MSARAYFQRVFRICMCMLGAFALLLNLPVRLSAIDILPKAFTMYFKGPPSPWDQPLPPATCSTLNGAPQAMYK